MGETPHQDPNTMAASNDNVLAAERLDEVVVTLARLLGRQLAREQFGLRREAANDNGGAPDAGGP